MADFLSFDIIFFLKFLLFAEHFRVGFGNRLFYASGVFNAAVEHSQADGKGTFTAEILFFFGKRRSYFRFYALDLLFIVFAGIEDNELVAAYSETDLIATADAAEHFCYRFDSLVALDMSEIIVDVFQTVKVAKYYKQLFAVVLGGAEYLIGVKVEAVSVVYACHNVLNGAFPHFAVHEHKPALTAQTLKGVVYEPCKYAVGGIVNADAASVRNNGIAEAAVVEMHRREEEGGGVAAFVKNCRQHFRKIKEAVGVYPYFVNGIAVLNGVKHMLGIALAEIVCAFFGFVQVVPAAAQAQTEYVKRLYLVCVPVQGIKIFVKVVFRKKSLKHIVGHGRKVYIKVVVLPVLAVGDLYPVDIAAAALTYLNINAAVGLVGIIKSVKAGMDIIYSLSARVLGRDNG